MTPGSSRSGSYAGLHAYLSGRYADNLVLSFAQIEDLIGFPLPAAARTSADWWSAQDEAGTTSPQWRAWTDAHRTATPNLFACTVRFERDVAL